MNAFTRQQIQQTLVRYLPTFAKLIKMMLDNMAKQAIFKPHLMVKPCLKSRRRQPVIRLRLERGCGTLFDEFDDSPQEARDISMDLVDELRQQERLIPDGPLIIDFRLNSASRDKAQEVSIAGRLKDYFLSQYEEYSANFNWQKRLGFFLLAGGILAEALMANAVHSFFADGFFAQIPDRMFTLLGYGGFFFGIEKLLEAYGSRNNLRLFERLKQAKIVFKDIEVNKTPKLEAGEADFTI